MNKLEQIVRRPRSAAFPLAAGAFAALGIAACSASDSTSGPPGTGTAQIAFNVAAPTVGASAATTSITVGGHTLSVDQVSFVVSRAELSGSTATDSCLDNDNDNDNALATGGTSFDKGSSDNGGSSANANSGRHDCGEVRIGPDTVNVPLDGSLVSLPSGVIPAGTFDRVEFRISQVVVSGTFDTTHFADTIAVNAKTEINLDPPLVVTDTSATSVTVNVPVLLWLQNADGSLVDPVGLTADPAALAAIRDKIMRSFRAFEDRNHDGRDDHDGGH